MLSTANRFVLSASLLALAALPARAQLVSQTFESGSPGSYPAGWSVRFGGMSQQVSTSAAFYSTRSFRLQAGPFNAAESYVPFAPPSGVWTMSWSVRLDSATTATSQGDLFVRFESSEAEIGGGFNRVPGGSWALFVGNGGTPVNTSPQTDRWYDFCAVVNPAAGVVDYYLDGVLVSSAVPFGSNQLSPRITAHAGAIDNGTLIGYVDQIRVVSGAQPGLVARYPFNGNTNDVSGNGYDAVAVNGVTNVPGRDGQAAYFDGVGAYCYADHFGRLTFDLDTQSYTAAGWLRIDPSAGPANCVLQDRWGSNAPVSCNLILYLSSPPRLNANSWNGVNENFEVVHNIVASAWYNEWHHVAITYRASTGEKTLYIDGSPVGTAQRASQPFPSTGNTRMTIGGYWGSNNQVSSLFKGSIDDLRIYNRALSAGEIGGLAASGSAACSIADITDIGDTGAGPDGQLTVDDFIAYVNAFSNGC